MRGCAKSRRPAARCYFEVVVKQVRQTRNKCRRVFFFSAPESLSPSALSLENFDFFLPPFSAIIAVAVGVTVAGGTFDSPRLLVT